MLETELKMQIKPEQKQAVLRHARVQQMQVGEVQEKHLVSAYYDTPAANLAQQGVVLRVRDAQGRFIQTLKTADEGIAGLQQRHEWECDVAQMVLELNKLPALSIVDQIREQFAAQLQLAFTTDFTRQVVILQNSKARIEMALDEGQIICRDQAQTLCEIELELLEGEISEVFAVAQAIASDIEVKFAPFNKAERGYQLMRVQHYSVAKPKCVIWETTTAVYTLGDCFIKVFSQLMQAWIANDKALRYAKKYTAIPLLLEIIQRLQLLLLFIPAILPRKTTAQLRAELAALKEILSQNEIEVFIALESSRYAQFMLNCGAFIVVRPWLENLSTAAKEIWQQPLQTIARKELTEAITPLLELKKRLPKLAISNVIDHQHTAYRLRILCEWFLGLYSPETAQAFFTVVCQVQGLLQHLTISAGEEERVVLGQKLTELGQWFKSLK